MHTYFICWLLVLLMASQHVHKKGGYIQGQTIEVRHFEVFLHLFSSDVKIVCALNSEEGKQRVHSRLALLLSSHDPLSNVHDTITYKNTNTSKNLSVWIKSTETWTIALWSVLYSYCTESTEKLANIWKFFKWYMTTYQHVWSSIGGT